MSSKQNLSEELEMNLMFKGGSFLLLLFSQARICSGFVTIKNVGRRECKYG